MTPGLTTDNPNKTDPAAWRYDKFIHCAVPNIDKMKDSQELLEGFSPASAPKTGAKGWKTNADFLNKIKDTCIAEATRASADQDSGDLQGDVQQVRGRLRPSASQATCLRKMSKESKNPIWNRLTKPGRVGKTPAPRSARSPKENLPEEWFCPQPASANLPPHPTFAKPAHGTIWCAWHDYGFRSGSPRNLRFHRLAALPPKAFSNQVAISQQAASFGVFDGVSVAALKACRFCGLPTGTPPSSVREIHVGRSLRKVVQRARMKFASIQTLPPSSGEITAPRFPRRRRSGTSFSPR